MGRLDEALWRGNVASRFSQAHPADDLRKAYDLLGLSHDAIPTPEAVRDAYVAAVKAAHPDSGGSGGDMQQLKWARNTVLAAKRLPNNNDATMQSELKACPMCRGRGRVATGFGNEPCATCHGTGLV